MADPPEPQSHAIPALLVGPTQAAEGSAHFYRFVPTPNRSEPTLAPTAYRLVQASRRRSELRPVIDEAGRQWSGKHPMPRARLSEAGPTDFGLIVDDFAAPRIELLNEMTFLASECINHVRTSLDYLAYHMVWRDQGQPYMHTQFPLRTERTGFGKSMRSALPGITELHKRWVEEVQPFAGTEWTAALEELSNRDKHRVPLEVVESYGLEIDPSKMFLDPLGDPEYRGFQVENPTLTYLLADPFRAAPNAPHLELERTLDIVILGAATFVNQFLREWGYSELDLQRANPQ